MGNKDRERALGGLAAFARHQIAGNPMPTVQWKHDDSEGRLRLTIHADPTPLGARLWVAASPTRDFREARWTAKPADIQNGTIAGEVPPPETGYVAFYGELDYKIDELSYHLSTQIRVAAKMDR